MIREGLQEIDAAIHLLAMNELVGMVVRTMRLSDYLGCTAPEAIDKTRVASEYGWTAVLNTNNRSTEVKEGRAILDKATGILRYELKPPVSGFLADRAVA